jgi:MFS family permease
MGTSRFAVLIACAAEFLVGADGLSVAIALPAIQRGLHADPLQAQWVLSAYGLAFGGTLLIAGRLGDLWGRRRMLIAGMIGFAAAALAAGLAPALGVLIAARIAQGLGSAAAMPAALALIGSLLPPGRERTRALSLMAATASVGIVSGLMIGGLVTGVLGWRWVFLLTAPLAAAAAVAAPLALPEARAQGSAPLVRIAILRVRSLRTAALGAAVNAISFTSIVYVGTLYLQDALHYRPLTAAFAIVPLNVVALVVPVLAGGAIAGRSPRALLAAAFACTALGLLWLARAHEPASYVPDVMAPLVLLGASLSVAFVVLTQEAVAEVDADEKGMASGIFETANHLVGGAAGVALYAAVLHAGGYRAAFLAAAALAALGVPVALSARRRAAPHGRESTRAAPAPARSSR